ncbi:MAG: FCD domain-containing protein [Prevotellaceae bacterium]|nr:FCD domain-containing protein [Prevotellaceae bacterium]
MAEASHNEIFLDLYKIASIHLKKWFKSIYSEINPLMKTHALHEQLAKHIIAGEPEKARDAAEKIIEQS